MDDLNIILLNIIEKPRVSIEDINRCLKFIRYHNIDDMTKERIINVIGYKIFNQTGYEDTKLLMDFLIDEKYESVSKIRVLDSIKTKPIIVNGSIYGNKKMKLKSDNLGLPKLGSYDLFMKSGLFLIEEEYRPSGEFVKKRMNEIAMALNELLHENDIKVDVVGTIYKYGFLDIVNVNYLLDNEVLMFSESDIWKFFNEKDATMEVIVVDDCKSEPLVVRLEKDNGFINSNIKKLKAKNLLLSKFNSYNYKYSDKKILQRHNESLRSVEEAISVIYPFVVPSSINESEIYRKRVIIPLVEKYILRTGFEYERALLDINKLYDLVYNYSFTLGNCFDDVLENFLFERIRCDFPEIFQGSFNNIKKRVLSKRNK